MKIRITALIILVIMALSLAACTEGSDVNPEENQALAGRQAGNEAVYYSFAYPNDWELSENDGSIAIRIDCDSSSATARYASINVLSFELSDTNTGARDYWNSYKKDLAAIMQDFTVLGGTEAETLEGEEGEVSEQPDGEAIELDGTVALRVKYSGKYTENTYIYDQVICCRNGTVYLLTLCALNADFDSVKPSFETVIDTFVFE